MAKQILVVKENGEKEPLNLRKVKIALRKSGARHSMAQEVIDLLVQRVYTGITTKEIYRIAFEELDKIRPAAAARFGLKSALMRLGPDGYPFETFVGSLLKGRGYSTKLRQIVRGKCVSHEIDVIARRPRMQGHEEVNAIVECKYHNSPGLRCHIQAALYSWARFLDIKEAKGNHITSAWLATNTKFSGDVIEYADCVGLKLLGWSFPHDESIQVRIEEKKLYPITILRSLDRRTFRLLHDAGIIILPELISAPQEELKKLRIHERKLSRLIAEAESVMKNSR